MSAAAIVGGRPHRTKKSPKSQCSLGCAETHVKLDREHQTNFDNQGIDIEQSRFNRHRSRTGSIINNYYVQLFILLLIVINAVFMGIGTFDFITENEEMNKLFENIDKGFLIIFTIELGLQVFYEGFRFFRDGWLLFDFLVVMMSWASDLTDGANLQVIRAFRIFRAFRLITRVKMMRDLVTALLDTIPNMSAIIFLLSIISYIFAVMFTSLYKDLSEVEDIDEEIAEHFSSLGRSLFTLFQLMTMDGWSNICREIMVIQPLAWIPFVAFVIITSFVAMNLVIAVICNAVNKQEENQLDEKNNRSEHSGEHSIGYADKFDKQIESIQIELEDLKKNQESIRSMMTFITSELIKSNYKSS